MTGKLDQLKALLAEYIDLNHSEGLLSWDQQANMPPGGAEERGDQISTLSRLAHQSITSPEIGRLLDDLMPEAAQMDPDSDEAALIRVANRYYQKETRIPTDWVSRFSKASALAFDSWARAKAESNFAVFQPFLEEIIRLRQEYASFFAPYEHIYDPFLDDYEPGMKTREVQAIFAVLRSEQVALIKAISQKPKPDASFLSQAFSESAQREFGIQVTRKLGYDWNRGRLDVTAHPFTTSFGQGDVRITTRYNAYYLPMSVFGTIHETGHALYDQGFSPAYRRTLLSSGASMSVHESQSRLFENLVGRSRAFWKFFYPILQTYFPGQLGSVSLESFYQAINKVDPSFIRVEADEATYNLHIMLRMELEIGMMDGSLAVKDLPEAWNSRMKEYLGITPPDNAQGVLQDVHWSYGYIGYFPTYALGNLVSAQLWEKILLEIPDLIQQFEVGEFSPLLSWLRRNVHQYGTKFEPQILIERITGSKIDPAPYMRYLKQKYSDIYGL